MGDLMGQADPKATLRQLLDAALAAALPEQVLPPHLGDPPSDKSVLVLAIGKAAAAMAQTVERTWASHTMSGLAVVPYGHAVPCEQIEIMEAGHPSPDEASIEAGRRLLEHARAADESQEVLVLISGGASSLATVPVDGVTLNEVRAVTAGLLASGATIAEMNAVRKHLCAVKGGGLAAAAHPARVRTLAISDVPGDDPTTIGSSPTVGDPTTLSDARRDLERLSIEVPESIRRALADPAHETLSPEDERLSGARYHIIASSQHALEAAAAEARRLGLTPVILSNRVEGEARSVGQVHAAIARQIARHGQPVTAPAVILSGGETTVRVVGRGQGGRNTEFLLAFALAVAGERGIAALAADTDGIDGTTHAAGAFYTPFTLESAASMELDPAASLADNDSFGFFDAVGNLVVTGPTRTNVNDFRAILVE